MRTKLLLFFQLLSFTAFLQAQKSDSIIMPNYLFDMKKWVAVHEETGKDVIIDTLTYKGKKAFHIPTWGMMKLKDSNFKNFVTEADIAGNMSNTMTGIGFRAKNFENFEYLYFRLMASNTNEAIQYLPVYNITIPWILYPKYQASATFNEDWTHIKLEVIDKQLKVFVNNSPTPNIVVNDLKGDSDSGTIVIVSEFADAYYANLTIERLNDNSISPVVPSSTDHFIQEWQLSGLFKKTNIALDEYKTIVDTATSWKTISPDGDGLVNLSKYFADPSGTVILKKSITTSTEKNALLLFDFNRQLGIVLNDSIIYSATDENNWMAMNEDDHYINFKLKKGKNNLAFIITGDYEQYKTMNRLHLGRFQSQNWGFIARIDTFNTMNVNKWKAVDETNNKTLLFDTVRFKNKIAFNIVENEMAFLKTENFKNAIIEADIFGTGWIGFGFHLTDSCNYDQFYFRQNASNSNEAIQYVTVSNGAVSWALQTDYQAKTIYNGWSHIKIVIIDNQAKVFLANKATPDIIVNQLRGAETGGILLEGVMGNSYVANLSITGLSDDLVSIKKPEVEKTNIKTWHLSGNFNKSSFSTEEYLAIKDTISSWKTISPNPDGMVNIAKYFKKPTGAALLKTTIYASCDTIKKLLFDHTQALQIILNDSIIYYRSRYTDAVKYDGNRLNIKLKKGNNELVFINSGDYQAWTSINYKHFNNFQSFNWGFVARIDTINTSPVLGILKDSLSRKIDIFPNPTHGKFTINFGTNLPKQAIVDVYNTAGELVLTQTIKDTSTATIDLTGCAKGIFLAKISADGSVFEEKIWLE